MKCQLIRDDLEVSPPSLAEHPDYQGCTEVREVMRNDAMTPVVFWKRGAILENPEAYYLVRQGCAIPADEACRVRARMTQERFDAAKSAYARLLAHIKPEDQKLFDDGVITGYDELGNFVLGKNGDKLKDYLKEEAAQVEDSDI